MDWMHIAAVVLIVIIGIFVYRGKVSDENER